MTPDQMGHDRILFFSETYPVVTAKIDKTRMSIGNDETRDVSYAKFSYLINSTFRLIKSTPEPKIKQHSDENVD